MYTQMSFWMPSVEAQLWYVAASATAGRWVDLVKGLTVYTSLITLALETAVTGHWVDLLACIPVAAVFGGMTLLRRTLSAECKRFLNEDLTALKNDLVRVTAGGAETSPPPTLEPHVRTKLLAAMLEPEKLRPYAEDIGLHPFLNQMLQGAGIADVGTRFKTIEALGGSQATPAAAAQSVGLGSSDTKGPSPPLLAPPSKQYLLRS